MGNRAGDNIEHIILLAVCFVWGSTEGVRYALNGQQTDIAERAFGLFAALEAVYWLFYWQGEKFLSLLKDLGVG
jgi:hypothetical protein